MLTLTAIAAARNELNRHFARNLRIAARRVVRRVRLAFARFAEARRHRRELEFLLHADDRILSDIGITRADVHFAYGEGRGATWKAAEARDEARAASQMRIETLPRVNAPAIAPGLPRQTIAHENFR